MRKSGIIARFYIWYTGVDSSEGRCQKNLTVSEISDSATCGIPLLGRGRLSLAAIGRREMVKTAGKYRPAADRTGTAGWNNSPQVAPPVTAGGGVEPHGAQIRNVV